MFNRYKILGNTLKTILQIGWLYTPRILMQVQMRFLSITNLRGKRQFAIYSNGVHKDFSIPGQTDYTQRNH